MVLGSLASAAFMGCRKSRFWDDQPAHQESKSVPSTPNTNKNLQLTSPSANGQVELNVIPLGSWGSFGAFWRAKNLAEETPTSLLVFEDLLDSHDPMTMSTSPISGEPKEPAQAPTVDKDPRALSQPEGIVFNIKKMEFISDENLASQRPPDEPKLSSRGLRSSSVEHRESHPWVLKLNPSVTKDLVAVYALPDDEVFSGLEDKIYTSPDELLADLEKELKDRGILGGDPSRLQKAQDVLARHLEDMTVEQAFVGEVAPLPSPRLSSSQDQHANTFGPFSIEIGVHDTPLIYNEGNDLKTPPVLTLAPGLYRTVRVTWGAVAQVKGCVGVGQETLCTRSSSSPYVTHASLRDFATNLPEFMDVPTTNDDPKWPLSGDWIQEYGIDLEVKAGSLSRLSLLYPMAGSLRFHQTGHDQGLLSGMPRGRPYFYMPSLRERLMTTAHPLGRLYDFVGTATLCEFEPNQAQPDCTGAPRETSGTALQIVTDSNGAPLRAIWQYPEGGDLIGTDREEVRGDDREGFRATFSDPSLWLDLFSSEAGNRVQGSRGGSEEETALWLRPAGSLGGDSSDLVRLESLPVALDRWQVGETKTLWAKKVPVKSPLKSPLKSKKSGGDGRELGAKVLLQRVL